MSRHFAAAAAVALASALAQAEALPDPTRPPSAGAASAEAGAGAGAAAPLGLQAVILRPQGRSVAIINGQTVAVGDQVGAARLISLTADEAVLEGPKGKEVLKLLPAVDKTRASAATAAKKEISGRGNNHD